MLYWTRVGQQKGEWGCEWLHLTGFPALLLMHVLLLLLTWGCPGSCLLHTGFELQPAGATSLLWCPGCSWQWLPLLGSTGSRCMGSAAPRMWNLSGAGIKPVSPPLAGSCFFPVPPEKSLSTYFNSYPFVSVWESSYVLIVMRRKNFTQYSADLERGR